MAKVQIQKGRPKTNKFEPVATDYYFSNRKYVTVYVGNEISAIHDDNINSRLKLDAMIRGFLFNDPKYLFSEFKLFGNLITPTTEFRKVFVESDKIDNDLFVIVSNVREINGFKIYAIFYVPWRDSEIQSISKIVPDTSPAAIGHCKWFLSFFRKYAKTIPATEEEITRIKEVIKDVKP